MVYFIFPPHPPAAHWEKHDFLLLSPETTTRGRPHAVNSATLLCFIETRRNQGQPCLLSLPQSNCFVSATFWLVFRGSHLALWLGNCAAFAAGIKCLIDHANLHKCNASKETVWHISKLFPLFKTRYLQNCISVEELLVKCMEYPPAGSSGDSSNNSLVDSANLVPATKTTDF